ncbi:alanine racemase [Jatrophihabitans sp. YIM 134969]
MPHAVASINLDAIAANVRTLAARTDAAVMVVVKADGYGHGMLPAARAALAGGAHWLGVATLDEALAIRADLIDAPLLAWLWTLDETDALREAIAAGVDIGVSTAAQLDAVHDAAASSTTARVHLKIDTGLSRNGATPADWPALVEAAAERQDAGTVEVVGIWSHLARADEPDEPTTAEQTRVFEQALAVAAAAGLSPEVRHLANSAGLLTAPATHYDLVRVGIAAYGLDPVVGGTPDLELRPAMTLRARVAHVKRVPPGSGVSYGHRYTTTRETTLVLVPVGYADGVPRAGSDLLPVTVGGHEVTIAGRVCMDQFVLDVGDLEVHEDDEVVLFGDGGPSAARWADLLDTIHYEIVTRIGPRVPRVHVGGAA